MHSSQSITDPIIPSAPERTGEERIRRSLDLTIEADADNQSNAERIQRALAMSMKGENGKNEIGYFKTMSNVTDEDTETNEERLQSAPAMSMADENYCDELAVSKVNIRLIQPVGLF